MLLKPQWLDVDSVTDARSTLCSLSCPKEFLRHVGAHRSAGGSLLLWGGAINMR